MKKLKDISYLQRGMVLLQGENEFEITKVVVYEPLLQRVFYEKRQEAWKLWRQ